MARARFLLAALVGLVGSPELGAQDGLRGTVTGSVVSREGMPLARALVRVLGTRLATTAADNGTFRLIEVPQQRQTLEIKLLGYAPVQTSVDVRAGEAVHVAITLSPVELEPIEVVSSAAVTPGMIGFEQRRSRGPGTFFTREDIVRIQARQFTDILRRVPGLQVRPMTNGRNNVSVQTRGSGCQVKFFMNGTAFPLPPDAPINDYVGPEEVMAIEVYSGSSEIPAEFNSSLNARCGVVMIWTRYGPEPKRPK